MGRFFFEGVVRGKDGTGGICGKRRVCGGRRELRKLLCGRGAKTILTYVLLYDKYKTVAAGHVAR
jgi:hypothetical protein